MAFRTHHTLTCNDAFQSRYALSVGGLDGGGQQGIVIICWRMLFLLTLSFAPNGTHFDLGFLSAGAKRTVEPSVGICSGTVSRTSVCVAKTDSMTESRKPSSSSSANFFLLLTLLLAPSQPLFDCGRCVGGLEREGQHGRVRCLWDPVLDGSEYLSLRLCLGGGPQVRLDLNVSLLSRESVSEENIRQVVHRIAWTCAPMHGNLDAAAHDTTDRPSFGELLGSAFHRRTLVRNHGFPCCYATMEKNFERYG